MFLQASVQKTPRLLEAFRTMMRMREVMRQFGNHPTVRRNCMEDYNYARRRLKMVKQLKGGL